jgi:hypothetical protein
MNNYYYDPYWTWNGYNPYFSNNATWATTIITTTISTTAAVATAVVMYHRRTPALLTVLQVNPERPDRWSGR